MDSEQPGFRRNGAHGRSRGPPPALVCPRPAQSPVACGLRLCMPARRMALEFRLPDHQAHLDEFDGAVVRRLVSVAPGGFLLADRREGLQPLGFFLYRHRHERDRGLHGRGSFALRTNQRYFLCRARQTPRNLWRGAGNLRSSWHPLALPLLLLSQPHLHPHLGRIDATGLNVASGIDRKSVRWRARRANSALAQRLVAVRVINQHVRDFRRKLLRDFRVLNSNPAPYRPNYFRDRQGLIQWRVYLSNVPMTGRALPFSSKNPREVSPPVTAGSHQKIPWPSPSGVSCTIRLTSSRNCF